MLNILITGRIFSTEKCHTSSPERPDVQALVTVLLSDPYEQYDLE